MANQNNTMMDLDFTGVESYANIPVGVHTVTVKEAVFTKAKNTGSDQLEVNFEDAHGATKKAWYSLVPQALWKVKNLLEALGISCEGKIRLNTRTIVGKHCQIQVEVDQNDTSRNIVSRVLRLDNAANAASVPAPEVPFNAIPSTPFVQPTPTAAPAPVSIPVTPAPAPVSPSEPVAASEEAAEEEDTPDVFSGFCGASSWQWERGWGGGRLLSLPHFCFSFPSPSEPSPPRLETQGQRRERLTRGGVGEE